eukprot:TRINITY_DN9662_c0_g1_i3.p1 TRINITY_DN9662_c0_g1~~TRINITY_DN9662_c0_g1_i3.p1  ORF type:complete len:640 (+),score=142.49 TRINITY_DN9662_c0_g1_i3:41-1960(+)
MDGPPPAAAVSAMHAARWDAGGAHGRPTLPLQGSRWQAPPGAAGAGPPAASPPPLPLGCGQPAGGAPPRSPAAGRDVAPARPWNAPTREPPGSGPPPVAVPSGGLRGGGERAAPGATPAPTGAAAVLQSPVVGTRTPLSALSVAAEEALRSAACPAAAHPTRQERTVSPPRTVSAPAPPGAVQTPRLQQRPALSILQMPPPVTLRAQARQTELALREAELNLHPQQQPVAATALTAAEHPSAPCSSPGSAAWGWLSEHEQVVTELKGLLSRHRKVLASLSDAAPAAGPPQHLAAPGSPPAPGPPDRVGEDGAAARLAEIQSREADLDKREQQLAAQRREVDAAEERLRRERAELERREAEQKKRADADAAAIAARAEAVAAREAAASQREAAAARREQELRTREAALCTRRDDLEARERALRESSAARSGEAAASCGRTRGAASPLQRPASPLLALPPSPRASSTQSPRRHRDPDSPKWREGKMHQVNPDRIASWCDDLSDSEDTEAGDRQELPAGRLLCTFEDVPSPYDPPPEPSAGRSPTSGGRSPRRRRGEEDAEGAPGEAEDEEDEYGFEVDGDEEYELSPHEAAVGMVQGLIDQGLLPPEIMEGLATGHIGPEDVAQWAADMGIQFVPEDMHDD